MSDIVFAILITGALVLAGVFGYLMGKGDAEFDYNIKEMDKSIDRIRAIAARHPVKKEDK